MHHASDPYTSTETNTDLNSIQERKAAHKNLHVVEFTGTVPAAPTIVPVRVHCVDGKPATMRINLNGYPGTLRMYFHRSRARALCGQRAGSRSETISRTTGCGPTGSSARSAATSAVGIPGTASSRSRDSPTSSAYWAPTSLTAVDSKAAELRNIECQQEGYVEFHVLVDRPARAKVGQAFPIEIVQLGAEGKEVIGGLSARVAMTEEPKQLRHELRVALHATRGRVSSCCLRTSSTATVTASTRRACWSRPGSRDRCSR